MLETMLVSIEGHKGTGKSAVLTELLPLLRRRLRATLLTVRDEACVELICQLGQDTTAAQDRQIAAAYAAVRGEITRHRLPTLLREHDLVLLERWTASDYAFRVQLGLDEVLALNDGCGVAREDLCLIFSCSPEVGWRRMQSRRRGAGRVQVDQERYRRVHQRYLDLAARAPWAHLVDTDRPLQQVAQDACQVICSHRERRC